MKLKTTNKQIRNNFNKIIKIGYCNAQSLLYFNSPFAYNCGVYGWNCDFYEINKVCISMGYNPIGTSLDYSKVNELEKKACIIVNDYSLNYEDRKKQVEILLNELINL